MKMRLRIVRAKKMERKMRSHEEHQNLNVFVVLNIDETHRHFLMKENTKKAHFVIWSMHILEQ